MLAFLGFFFALAGGQRPRPEPHFPSSTHHARVSALEETWMEEANLATVVWQVLAGAQRAPFLDQVVTVDVCC